MESHFNGVENRRVLVGTAHGLIEGDLALGPRLRTLDYLNRSSTLFVTLHGARPLSSRPPLQSDTVHVNIAAIAWVAEVEAMRRSGNTMTRPQLNRAAVRFCFPDCEILGFLHTPTQGDPLARLNQERSPFLAVTSASIIGSETEMAAAFLAVNIRHAFTVEMVADDDAVEEDASVFSEAGS